MIGLGSLKCESYFRASPLWVRGQVYKPLDCDGLLRGSHFAADLAASLALRSLLRSGDLECFADFSVGVEADAAIEIAHQPLAEVNHLCAAAPLVSKFQLPVIAALKRTTRLHPARPFVQRLPKKLPCDQCNIARTGLQRECAVHNDLRRVTVLTTPGNQKGWAQLRNFHRESAPLPMRLWDRAGIIRADAAAADTAALAGCSRFVSPRAEEMRGVPTP